MSSYAHWVKNTKIVILTILLAIFTVTLSGQSNEMIDSFLSAETADMATSLLFIAQAAGDLPVDTNLQEGYSWGTKQDFGKHIAKKASDDPISLGVFYLALLKTFNIRGGFLFNWFETPRYATNEAVYRGYVDPSRQFYTRTMEPYEVLTAITYLQDDIANQGRNAKETAK